MSDGLSYHSCVAYEHLGDVEGRLHYEFDLSCGFIIRSWSSRLVGFVYERLEEPVNLKNPMLVIRE